MTNSETITKIAPALVAAQEGMEAKEESYNPFFKSKYADVSVILKTIRPTLKENGLVTVQSMEQDGMRMTCTTTILHESGEWIKSCFSLDVANSKPQDFGSAATYVRRYGLCAALNIATNQDEDDDGNAADKDKQKELLKAKDSETLAKIGAQLFGVLGKYGIEVFKQSFADNGFLSDIDSSDPETIARDLIKQVPKWQKLESIGRNFKTVQDRMSKD